MTMAKATEILGIVQYQFFIDVDVSRFTTRDELITAYDEWWLRCEN